MLRQWVYKYVREWGCFWCEYWEGFVKWEGICFVSEGKLFVFVFDEFIYRFIFSLGRIILVLFIGVNNFVNNLGLG